MIAGVLAVIAIYLLFNLALLHALPFAQLAGSKLAANDAAALAFGASGRVLDHGALHAVGAHRAESRPVPGDARAVRAVARSRCSRTTRPT
jgi:hypothetical protein